MLVEGKEVVVTGRFPRTARLRDEWFEHLQDPEDALRELMAARIPADLFTFLEPIPNRVPMYPYYHEPCPAAVTA